MPFPTWACLHASLTLASPLAFISYFPPCLHLHVFYGFSGSPTLPSSYHVFRCVFVPSCNTDSCLRLHVLKPTCHTQAWGGKFHFQRFFVRCERTSECLGILGNRTLVSESSGFLTLCLWDTGKGEACTWAAERLSVGSSLCSGGCRTMALFSFSLYPVT